MITANCGVAIHASRASSLIEHAASRPPPSNHSLSASHVVASTIAASLGASGTRTTFGATAPCSGGVITVTRSWPAKRDPV
jgi:hypothetical protein